MPKRTAAFEDSVKVDLIRFAAIDDSPRGMGDGRNMRIGQGIDDAFCDLITGLILAVVDAGDDPIGVGQHLVVEVETSAFEDVAFDAP